MIIRLASNGEATLEEEFDFSRFVVIAKNIVHKRDLECGAIDPDGRHVWIDKNWLSAKGPKDRHWVEGVDNMISFAERKGWLDSDGRIRAHIE
jgi:hypothetical protein